MNQMEFLELAVSLSLQITVVVVATFLFTRPLQDARTTCRIWGTSYVVMLLLLLAALLLPHPRWLPRVGGALSRPAAQELLTQQLSLGQLLLSVWGLGATGVCGWLVWQSVRVARFLKSCQPVASDHAALRECHDVIEHGGVPVRILTSSTLAGPFCWQFHRPYIVLPDFLLGLEPRDLKFVLRHEMAHLRTGHPVQLFWQHAVETLFWFHPLVWWAGQQVSRAREFACDDAAIPRREQIADFLRTLLIVVEHGTVELQTRSQGLSFGRSPAIIVARAHRLAEIARFGWRPPQSRRWLMGRLCVWLMAIVSCLALWPPVSVFASPRSLWSPWPRWSAKVLREFGIQARDFEVYDGNLEPHELLLHDERVHQDFAAQAGASTATR